jgi:hypothetical protein
MSGPSRWKEWETWKALPKKTGEAKDKAVTYVKETADLLRSDQHYKAGAIRIGGGALAGLLAGLVLAGPRKPAGLAVFTAFGSGVGVGSTWTRVNLYLEKRSGAKKE